MQLHDIYVKHGLDLVKYTSHKFSSSAATWNKHHILGEYRNNDENVINTES